MITRNKSVTVYKSAASHLLAWLLAAPACLADDTEIYVSNSDTDTPPNVVFLFDTSGSMATSVYEDGQSVGSRLDVVRDAAIDVLNNVSGINIALARFNTNSEGGRLSTPMLSIDDDGIKDLLGNVLDNYSASGGTPLTESLYEIAQFYRGGSMTYGSTDADDTDQCMVSSSTDSAFNNGSGMGQYASLQPAAPTTSDGYVVTRGDYVVSPSRQVFSSNGYRYQRVAGWNNGNNGSNNGSNNGNGGWNNGGNNGSNNGNGNGNNNDSSDDNSDDSSDTSSCEEYLNLDDTHDGSGNYVSPITASCQKNHIVVFTDGEPNGDKGADSQIRTWLSTLASADFPVDEDFSETCGSNGADGDCAEELPYFLYNTDNSEELDDDQPIYVHTIGGFIGDEYEERLAAMAEYGGGISGSGDDTEALTEALNKVFATITATSGTFAAPAAAVSAFNSLEHLDELYYSVFKPSETAAWRGNIKRYRLGSDGTIYDANGDAAIDEDSGYFADDATSYWTESEDAPDGSDVTLGGAARRMDDASARNVLTNFASNNLTASGNRITSDNTDLYDLDAFSDLSDDDKADFLLWLSGIDPDSADGDARREMEDPLHSQPLMLTYGTRTNASSGESEPDVTLFVGTNSGYFHAIDTAEDDPAERFAFIPTDLFDSALSYFNDDTSKAYGLDGKLSSYHVDSNNDDIVDSDEEALLFIGMRRGGKNYYALNVADRDNPKLAWEIVGGSGDFEEMGQSWSELTPVTVLWKGSQQTVLFFGGGYDEAEDDNNQRTEHSMGNAVYMVDYQTGELLWKASNTGANLNLTDMTSAIVADIVPVDADNDGDADILYTADLGGRIWRFDLAQDSSDSNSASSFASGGVIADVGEDDTETNITRFYTTPDVSYQNSGNFVDEDGAVYTAGRYQIVIGSGYRAHPLDTTTVDNIYVINDFDTDAAPDSYTTVERADLAEVGSLSSATASQMQTGLYYQLTGDGEKILTNATTLNGYTYITSYLPPDGTSSSCETDLGTTDLYILQLVYSVNDDGDQEASLQVDTIDTNAPGIAGLSAPLYVDSDSSSSDAIDSGNNDDDDSDSSCDNSAILAVGTVTVKTDNCQNTISRSYWQEY